jgi:hypothetical protein
VAEFLRVAGCADDRDAGRVEKHLEHGHLQTLKIEGDNCGGCYYNGTRQANTDI